MTEELLDTADGILRAYAHGTVMGGDLVATERLIDKCELGLLEKQARSNYQLLQ